MKPDWKDAPPWAEWLAMDHNGDWFWYELKPELRQTFWMQSVSGKVRLAELPVDYANDWRNSLEKRQKEKSP